MNLALLIAQIMLVIAFLMAGMMKLTQPKEKLAQKMPFAEDFTPGILRLIGLLEVLGAIGVIVPYLTGILPSLTAWAAIGLMLVMIGAMITHIRRKEYPFLIVNLILFALAAFVAWERWLQ